MPNETELRSLGKYFNMLLKNSIDGVLLLDRDGHVECCSDILLRLLNPEDYSLVKGHNIRELYQSFESGSFIEEAKLRSQKAKESRSVVVVHTKLDFPCTCGRSYKIIITPLFDDDGLYQGSISIYHDTADLLDAEEECTKALLDATPMACSFWIQNGETATMIDCNMEALNIFGLSSKLDYVGHFYDLNPEYQPDGTPTAEKAEKLIKTAFEIGYLRFEWMYLTAAGEPLPVETTLVRVPYRGGYGLAAYSRDLREIKAKEEEVREAEARMRAMLGY